MDSSGFASKIPLSSASTLNIINAIKAPCHDIKDKAPYAFDTKEQIKISIENNKVIFKFLTGKTVISSKEYFIHLKSSRIKSATISNN